MNTPVRINSPGDEPTYFEVPFHSYQDARTLTFMVDGFNTEFEIYLKIVDPESSKQLLVSEKYPDASNADYSIVISSREPLKSFDVKQPENIESFSKIYGSIIHNTQASGEMLIHYRNQPIRIYNGLKTRAMYIKHSTTPTKYMVYGSSDQINRYIIIESHHKIEFVVDGVSYTPKYGHNGVWLLKLPDLRHVEGSKTSTNPAWSKTIFEAKADQDCEFSFTLVFTY